MNKSERAVTEAWLKHARHRLVLLRIYQKNLDQQRTYYEERAAELEASLKAESETAE